MNDIDETPESVSIVLLREDETGRLRPLGDDDTVVLDAGGGLDGAVVGALLDAAVRLAVPEDIDPVVADAIAALPVPAAFRNSPWLYEHRVVVLRNGRCTVGDTTLRYLEGIGLRLGDIDYRTDVEDT